MVVSIRYKLKFKDLEQLLAAYKMTQKTNPLRTIISFTSLVLMVVQFILMFNYFIQESYFDFLISFIISFFFLIGFLGCFPLTQSKLDALILFAKSYLTKKTEVEIYLDESSFFCQMDRSYQLKWEEIKRVIEFPSIFLIIPRNLTPIYGIPRRMIYGIPKRVITDADIDTFKQILASQNIELEQR